MIDEPQTQIFFYFPGVFSVYYHCQKVLSPYVLALWRRVVFSLKMSHFSGNFHSIGRYRQITDHNLFYFPEVFSEYYHCQKVLSPYLLPFWRYIQSKMVFLLKMSHFSGDFHSIMVDIDKSKTTIFFIFLKYFQNTITAKRFWVHIYCHFGGIFSQKWQ